MHTPTVRPPAAVSRSAGCVQLSTSSFQPGQPLPAQLPPPGLPTEGHCWCSPPLNVPRPASHTQHDQTSGHVQAGRHGQTPTEFRSVPVHKGHPRPVQEALSHLKRLRAQRLAEQEMPAKPRQVPADWNSLGEVSRACITGHARFRRHTDIMKACGADVMKASGARHTDIWEASGARHPRFRGPQQRSAAVPPAEPLRCRPPGCLLPRWWYPPSPPPPAEDSGNTLLMHLFIDLHYSCKSSLNMHVSPLHAWYGKTQKHLREIHVWIVPRSYRKVGFPNHAI